MEYCTQCGAEMPEGRVFCTNCGAKKEMAEPVQTVYEEAPQPKVEPKVTYAPQPQPTYHKTVYTTNGWILGLKILGWITFVFSIIVGVIAGIASAEIIGAIIGLFAGAFIGFMSVAFIMVFLGIAQDLKRIRRDLEEMKH